MTWEKVEIKVYAKVFMMDRMQHHQLVNKEQFFRYFKFS